MKLTSTDNESVHIVLIDDESSALQTLQFFLRDEGYLVSAYNSSTLALQEIQTFDQQPDVILTDLRMPELDGIKLLRKLRKANIQSEVIVLTAYADDKDAIEAFALGAYDYMTKPYQLDELKVLVQRAVEKQRLRQENTNLKASIKRERIHTLVAHSDQMQSIDQMVDTIAPTDTTILITGESGVGKEVLAREIWRRSQRSDEAFLAINCGAIPESLLESELFGHLKGSFTGADKDKKGFFEQANNGTLFLDEIGELAMDAQVKLLRVLQEHTVRSIGSTKETNVNVRLVCATNKNLEEMVQRGVFREDLYYRVNVIHIHIPPLRERPADVLPLAQHFAHMFSARHNREDYSFSDEDLQYINNHSFPGNIRELQNWVERRTILGKNTVRQILSQTASIDPQNNPNLIDMEQIYLQILKGDLPYDEAMGMLESKLLQRAMLDAHDRVGAAASILGLTLRQMRYKLSKLP